MRRGFLFCSQDAEIINRFQKEMEKTHSSSSAVASIPHQLSSWTKASVFTTEELPPLLKIASASVARGFQRQRYTKQQFSKPQTYLLSLMLGQDV